MTFRPSDFRHWKAATDRWQARLSTRRVRSLEQVSPRSWGGLFVLVIVVGGAGLLGGCQKPLFPQDLPRTPYERYQTLRGEYRSPVLYGAAGSEQLNLRGRLTPLGEP